MNVRMVSVLAVRAGVAAALHDELGGALRPPRTPASARRAGPPLLSQPCRAFAQRGLTRGARRQSLIHLMLDRWSCPRRLGGMAGAVVDRPPTPAACRCVMS
jgi:hypothetical protein